MPGQFHLCCADQPGPAPNSSFAFLWTAKNKQTNKEAKCQSNLHFFPHSPPKKAVRATPPPSTKNCSLFWQTRSKAYFTLSDNYCFVKPTTCAQVSTVDLDWSPQEPRETVFLKSNPSPWIINYAPELNLIANSLGICHKEKKIKKRAQTYTPGR